MYARYGKRGAFRSLLPGKPARNDCPVEQKPGSAAAASTPRLWSRPAALKIADDKPSVPIPHNVNPLFINVLKQFYVNSCNF